jgi:hypothetical protein
MTAPLKEQQNTASDPETFGLSEQAQRPIWEIVAEIGVQISDEEWEKVPSDASINYKHYLYGAPKKNT